MYPNHQHPRHSDFPITVTQPPHPATFAWNYGGIQGISAENFDEQHSYLIQLSIFNYDCFNTGQPTGGGEPTGQIPGTTGEPTGIIIIPGGGGNEPGGIPGGGGGQPPWPGGPGIANPPGGNNPGGSGPRPPRPAVGRIPGPPQGPVPSPTPPRGPRTGGRVPFPSGQYPGGGGGLPGASGEPSGEIIVPRYFEVETGNVLPPLEPTLGTQLGNNGSVISSEPLPFTISFNRPSETLPGGTLNPNLSFVSVGISPSIPGEPNTNISLPQPNSSVNVNTVAASNEGNIPGNLSSKILGSSVVGESTINQVNVSSLESSALMDVMVASEVVTIGQPIVISCVFTPPTAMQAKVTISIQDNNQNVPVASTALLEISPISPLTCGTSTLSSLYNLGQLVVTCIVRDLNDLVIGIKSVIVSNIEEVNTGNVQSSKVTISDDLPCIICNHGSLSNNTVSIDLSANTTKYVILSSELPVSTISSVLQTNDRAQGSYSLAVYTPTGNDTDFLDGGTISGAFIQAQSSAYSDSRYKINGEEVYPHTHSAGLSNAEIPTSSNIALEISSSSSTQATKGRLYLSESLSLRAASGVPTSSSLTGYLPYGSESYGLVLHGKTSGQVPVDYVERLAVTDNIGVAVWNSISLTEGDFYSIVPLTRGVVNPFVDPIHTGIYTT
tara:strand:+ start:111837 stop:113837 length:2001 start_codon:yes stop_codon:yes gene_type:complete